MQVDLKPASSVATDWAMGGGSTTRGFWTKRKRTAMSLLAIMALVAGIALAFKLFEQEVPNNVVRDASNFDFTIQARDRAAGETIFHDVPGDGSATVQDSIFLQGSFLDPTVDVSSYPGDSRTSDVIIKNTNSPARSASFQTFVRQSSITVFRFCDNVALGIPAPPAGCVGAVPAYQPVVSGSPEWTAFVGFWTLTIRKQAYNTLLYTGPPVSCPNNDCGEQNPNSNSSYVDTNCVDVSLRSATPLASCQLGIIRAAGSRAQMLGSSVTGDAANSDDRQYQFTMTERDTGSDQSAFKGWRIVFTLVFQARVPAAPEGDRYNGYL